MFLFSNLPAEKFFKEIHEENALKDHWKAFSSWILLSSLNADNKTVDSTEPEPAQHSVVYRFMYSNCIFNLYISSLKCNLSRVLYCHFVVGDQYWNLCNKLHGHINIDSLLLSVLIFLHLCLKEKLFHSWYFVQFVIVHGPSIVSSNWWRHGHLYPFCHFLSNFSLINHLCCQPRWNNRVWYRPLHSDLNYSEHCYSPDGCTCQNLPTLAVHLSSGRQAQTVAEFRIRSFHIRRPKSQGDAAAPEL